jgi:hypothetical protein
MSKRPNIGDLFEVQIDSANARVFQYISNDSTQLHSDVVRVFREAYTLGEPMDVRRILEGEIDFHAHVLLMIGLKQKIWRKIGHAEPPGDLTTVLFRDSGDYGNPKIRVSKNWYVWKINSESDHVGVLSERYQGAEIGVVVPPNSLVYRMRNGKYDFVYPDY